MSDPASRLRLLLQHDPVVVTGSGVVSGAGEGTAGLWAALTARRSPAAWHELPRPGGGVLRCAGVAVPDFDWSGHPWAGMARRLDPASQFALRAAYAAAGQAGLLDDLPDKTRTGVICGSSRGPLAKWEEAHDLLRAGRRMRPTLAATTIQASATGAVAQVLGALGPSWMLSTACASGAFAIAAAAEQIALGRADIMLAGGADEALHAVIVAGLEAAGVLAHGNADATALCRPFCQDRTGLVPGNGAGFLVLESLTSARRRGAVPLARLSGWGTGIDPEGLAGMDPQGTGLQRSLRTALAMAALDPSDISYVNAHGTGTLTNDNAETAAISAVFGPDGPAVSSSKAITGHCLGASPALEAILCIEALRRRTLPPAFPEGPLDPVCAALTLSPGGPCEGLRHAVSTSAAFWGYHASLLFSRA